MGIIKYSVGVALIALSSFTHAQFNGKTVQLTYFYPNLTSLDSGPYSAVVSPDVEFPIIGGNSDTVDISDTSISLGFWRSSSKSSGDFNGYEIFDVNGTISDILDVSIRSITDFPGFDASRVTFDANHIRVNLQGLAFTELSKVVLDVQFEPTKPEPVSSVGILDVGDGAVTLNWTAPNDNGYAITKYKVTGVPGGTCTSDIDPPATAPATSCTVTGLTNGTPYKFTVVATNANGDSAPSLESAEAIPSADLMFVGAGPNITLAGGVVAATYSQTLQVTGGLPPYTFSVTGELPPGLELDTDTGIISGTPTTPGTYSFSVMAIDSAVQPTLAAKAVHVAEQTFTIVITAAPVVQATPTPVPALGGVGLLLLSGVVAGSMGLMRRRKSN